MIGLWSSSQNDDIIISSNHPTIIVPSSNHYIIIMAFPGDSDLPGTWHSMRFGGSSSTDAGGTLKVKTQCHVCYFHLCIFTPKRQMGEMIGSGVVWLQDLGVWWGMCFFPPWSDPLGQWQVREPTGWDEAGMPGDCTGGKLSFFMSELGAKSGGLTQFLPTKVDL